MIFHTEKNNLSIPDDSQNIRYQFRRETRETANLSIFDTNPNITGINSIQKQPIYQFHTETENLSYTVYTGTLTTKFIKSIQNNQLRNSRHSTKHYQFRTETTNLSTTEISKIIYRYTYTSRDSGGREIRTGKKLRQIRSRLLVCTKWKTKSFTGT